jgi:hypothetical protein
MDVHPVLPRIAEASQLQLPRPGPDGQPTESSQLAQPVPLLVDLPARGCDIPTPQAPGHTLGATYPGGDLSSTNDVVRGLQIGAGGSHRAAELFGKR